MSPPPPAPLILLESAIRKWLSFDPVALLKIAYGIGECENDNEVEESNNSQFAHGRVD